MSSTFVARDIDTSELVSLLLMIPSNVLTGIKSHCGPSTSAENDSPHRAPPARSM